MDDSPAPASAPKPRSIGERLRAGRERAGLSMAAAAEKLHLDIKVIEALESDRFAELGASVYVRGHLRRYGDFVGEPGLELVNAYSARAEARPPPPDLTQIPQAERRSDPRRLVTPLVGLGCALVLALAIWWVLAGSKSAPPAAVTADQPQAPAAHTPAAPVSPPVQVVTAPSAAAPVSNAPAPTNAPAAAAPAATTEPPPPARETRLRLELTNESWIEVYDSRGERLFYDVAGAGSVQSIVGRPPLRVVLGNAAAVAVQVDGQPRDIPSGALDGEGARFVVNRSGNLSRSRQ
jgi:cytoskeleton protein RodZ